MKARYLALLFALCLVVTHGLTAAASPPPDVGTASDTLVLSSAATHQALPVAQPATEVQILLGQSVFDHALLAVASAQAAPLTSTNARGTDFEISRSVTVAEPAARDVHPTAPALSGSERHVTPVGLQGANRAHEAPETPPLL